VSFVLGDTVFYWHHDVGERAIDLGQYIYMQVKACMRSSEMDLQAFPANGGYIRFLLFFLKVSS
jgi:hypothetical protein